ncbi:hypothetical protein MCOR27_011248 [Pyricularia oryzae]|uniref:FAD/NAD(P)-binding domain-containing protein n=5 Tax=Pyricularia TaxID=48558 RepID=A0ABQ8N582_PYRGI|nr:uncharacterized protein MGG_06179 [Pyricularia oryzae 70-15]ELQ42855.1 hypothetical protein OOU_Y34scaffold00192g41 [Pyricularia oryzae Y34]KAH8847505.1 hypothetical protein MCOR01_000928 [Pyricularia oryzae]KAI6290629.1 hypothetical protein MCOR33_011172 [Pyricularia grisea]EHA52254.1 hypothetical protein MGG_06179 [Pyricularia oryzae 70-15]KAI6252291.1 hypothetical protein MCOR19_011092 [Pyricularia oryzae]
MSNPKTVVILGGSYAGVLAAHTLLKKHKTCKVVLVSKNSHFYWNIASVRAIIPGVIQDEQILQPLSKALSHYPEERWELIVGGAEASDFAAKTVTIAPGDGGASRTLTYDHLVLATGANTAGDQIVPWKAHGTYEELVQGLRDTAESVKNASSVVVAGGGSTGVELAGEIGYEYGKTKEVWLVTGDKELLAGDITASSALSELTKLNVKVRFESRVQSTEKTEDGKIKVTFVGGGEPIVTDVYLPTMGLIPNTQYIDPKFLNERKYVAVDEFYRVKGGGAEGVWAAGDIVSSPRASFLVTEKQAAGVANNILNALAGSPPAVVKLMPVDIFAMSVGRDRGVGRMGPIKMLSFMVWLAKGRTLALPKMAGYMEGSVA